MEYETNEPKHIKVRGAKVHNLKNIDVDVPLPGVRRLPLCQRGMGHLLSGKWEAGSSKRVANLIYLSWR